MKDAPQKLTGGRPESPALATIDDTLGACIGIRYAVAAIAERSGLKLTEDDRAELMAILNLTNDIQDSYLALRSLFSRQFQGIEQ